MDDMLIDLVQRYLLAKEREAAARIEVEALKAAIDETLGERSQMQVCDYEIRRVPATLSKRWDNKMLNRLIWTLRCTENNDLAEAIRACQVEEPRRGYLRISAID